MSANPNRRRLYDVGEAGSRSRSVDSSVRAEGPMNRTSNHYDPYYSPTSPVGRVRAARPKYLGTDFRTREQWERTEGEDPSSRKVVDPAHEEEAAQLLRSYYEAVRRDRIIGKVSILASFFGLSGIGILCGWLFSNLMFTVTGIAFGVFIAYQILNGWNPFVEKAPAAKRELKASKYFRDRSVLDGYLITTHNQAVVWEAVGLEQRRRTVDLEAVRLGSHLHLPEHRKTEIADLQRQEQELRQRIVDMLDPEPDTRHLSDEARAAVAARAVRGLMVYPRWDEGGEQG